MEFAPLRTNSEKKNNLVMILKKLDSGLIKIVKIIIFHKPPPTFFLNSLTSNNPDFHQGKIQIIHSPPSKR